jgi:hypothetical protein
MERPSCELEPGPLFRVWLCGPFCLERRQGSSYVPLPVSAWGGSAYPRQLLKALLCCPGRQAHRERLLAWLWPEAEADLAASKGKGRGKASQELEMATRGGGMGSPWAWASSIQRSIASRPCFRASS